MGKLVCVVMMFWGNFLISLIIVSLANLVEFDRSEAKAYFQITNELAIIESFHAGSNLIKSFFRFLIIKRKEEERNQIQLQLGNTSGLAVDQSASRKAMFELRQRAKQFRQINSELMMTTQKVPIDILLHQVYGTVDTKLDELKNDMISGVEMERLLKEVEEGQVRLEEQLSLLKGKNIELLKTLEIPYPLQGILSGKASEFTPGKVGASYNLGRANALGKVMINEPQRQFTFLSKHDGYGKNTRNLAYQNVDSKPLSKPLLTTNQDAIDEREEYSQQHGSNGGGAFNGQSSRDELRLNSHSLIDLDQVEKELNM